MTIKRSIKHTYKTKDRVVGTTYLTCGTKQNSMLWEQSIFLVGTK
jgi:hypothetical protein